MQAVYRGRAIMKFNIFYAIDGAEMPNKEKELASESLSMVLAILAVRLVGTQIDGVRVECVDNTPSRCDQFPGGEQCGRPLGHEGKCVWLRGD